MGGPYRAIVWCVLRTITFQRNYLCPRYLASWLVLVKFEGQGHWTGLVLRLGIDWKVKIKLENYLWHHAQKADLNWKLQTVENSRLAKSIMLFSACVYLYLSSRYLASWLVWFSFTISLPQIHFTILTLYKFVCMWTHSKEVALYKNDLVCTW